MTIHLIRHGKTAGNLVKRYIGVTDEPLCEQGERELRSMTYPDCDSVAVSPMKRCIQTAGIICPDKPLTVYEELRECDFGDFEGKNHDELKNNADYLAWLEKGGMAKFPGGEDSTGFRERSVNGFLNAVRDLDRYETVLFVVHGGTIMSVLSALAEPRREFYEYMTENAHGWSCLCDGRRLTVTGKI